MDEKISSPKQFGPLLSRDVATLRRWVQGHERYETMHTFAIVVHATSAIAAFIIGVVLIFQRNTLRQLQLARAFLVLLILMGVFLVIAILSHVTSLPTIKQLIFGGLVILGVYMIWRAVQAVTVLTKQHQEDQLKVIDHVGFVLISLFDGFAIVRIYQGIMFAK